MKNMNKNYVCKKNTEKVTERFVSGLGNLMIRNADKSLRECLIFLTYEPEYPIELFEKEKDK